MLIKFEEMPSSSRVWIYQAEKPFTEELKSILQEKLNGFISGWESHGVALKASWKLIHDLFLVIAVDESQHAASGCSIDKCVHLIRELEQELQIVLLNKSAIAIFENDKIARVDVKNLKKAVQEGIIGPETVIFNNLVPTLAEMDQHWMQPASKSWLSRYFNR